jgi:hypothetical protein
MLETDSRGDGTGGTAACGYVRRPALCGFGCFEAMNLRGTGGPPVSGGTPPCWLVLRPRKQERSDPSPSAPVRSPRSSSLRSEYRPKVTVLRDQGQAARATSWAGRLYHGTPPNA